MQGDGLMLYRHCPRCRLAIRCRASYLTLEHCPRCLGRAGILTAMFTSPLNALELRDTATDGNPAIAAHAARETHAPRPVRTVPRPVRRPRPRPLNALASTDDDVTDIGA